MVFTCLRTVSVYPNYCTFFAPALALKSWISYIWFMQYDSIIRKSMSKICNVNFNESSYTRAIFPVSKEGIGIASASQIALPAFLASATGAKCALSCILPEDYVDASFEKTIKLWLTKANLSEAPPDFIQKHWTSPLSDATFDQLITDLDVENVKRLNAYQDPFASAWLNVVPSKKSRSEVNRSAIAHLVIRVAVNRSNFSGRKDRGRTFWTNCRDRMECGRILSYLL